jgi:serine protease AprX
VPLTRETFEKLLLESAHRRRFTQDSPVYADVWLKYFDDGPDKRQDLLLEPHHRTPVGRLAKAVHDRLGAVELDHRMAYAGEYVAVQLTLRELLGAVLPLSKWWRDLSRPTHGPVFEHLEGFAKGAKLAPASGGEPQPVPPPEPELAWWLRVAAALLTNASASQITGESVTALRRLTRRVLDELGHPTDAGLGDVRPLWSVSLNRPVRATLWRSREAVKADAAGRVFPTYDFTTLRDQIAAALARGPRAGAQAKAIQDALDSGLAVDWGIYEPLIRIEHAKGYRPPEDAHGTHVAGTLAGDWRPDDPGSPTHPLTGVCPGLALYDLRVLDDAGTGDEFSVLAALSYVRWRNAQSGGTVIHGVNLSFSLAHDVRNSACGRSPVCLEAERVHNAGVVVVAAAGNEGRADFTYRTETTEGYRTVSISDPGNTDVAITVGSTHRIEPHAYGVSYFSSRGPTGDGRAKPDLVAPGEKITAPVPGEKSARMDGTSMAAPHVSGAAALLMARHRELVGRPDEVKRVLCRSATDLGRERHYQGHGMLDILRALQSV